MLDLEKEKVSARSPGGAAGRAQVPPQPSPREPGVRFMLLIRTDFSCFCPGAVWVTNDHPSTLLFTYYTFRGLCCPGLVQRFRTERGVPVAGSTPKPMGPRAHE